MNSWSRAGRNVYTPPQRMGKAARKRIRYLKTVLAKGRNTIYDVYEEENKLGQVTTRFGVQRWRIKTDSPWIIACFVFNEEDPLHGWAMDQLVQARNKCAC